MKRLVIVLLCTLLSGCIAISQDIKKKMAGPQPKPLGVNFGNIEEKADVVQFTAVFFVNKYTEKLTVLTKVSNKGESKFIAGPSHSQYFPDSVRAVSKESMGIGLELEVGKDVEQIKFIMNTFRGAPTKDHPLWHKKNSGERTFTLQEILEY